MYAMVDRDDDLKIGVKSSAIVFGDMDKLIIGMLQALMLYALYLVGTNMEFGYWYNMGLVGAGVFFVYQQWRIRERKPQVLLQGLPQQPLRRVVGVHRHPARVRVPALTPTFENAGLKGRRQSNSTTTRCSRARRGSRRSAPRRR